MHRRKPLPSRDVAADGVQSFDGFKPFGGWTKPNLKVYAEGVSLGGTVVDRL
ncbi:hypothetical protein ACFQ69_02660 [Streptomyces sp. NPDC056470]|uniref:hypothetical protein n=1 Tax=Streptomyces sp. NPDC056470 TaxID=3345831 RepID=UPI0036C96343